MRIWRRVIGLFLLKRSASVFNGMQIRQILQMSAQTAAAPAAHPVRICCGSCCCLTSYGRINSFRAIPHNPKCRYGEQGTADAKPKAQIILDAAKVSAASGGNSEPKQGQRSRSARGFRPRSTMRVPQPDIIEHFGNADAVPQPPERCLSRQAGIVRCCLSLKFCRCFSTSVGNGLDRCGAFGRISLVEYYL